jgi:hypothetical protein
MAQQTGTPIGLEDDLRVEVTPEIRVPEAKRPPEPTPAPTIWLFVLAAFVLAVAFGAWFATRDSAPDLAPSAHDSVISQMVREQQASVGVPSGHDALINQLLRERQTELSGAAHDGWANRLGQQQGSRTASDHDSWIQRALSD